MRSPIERATQRYTGGSGRRYQEAVHRQLLVSSRAYRAKARLARRRYFRDLPEAARVFEFGVGTGFTLAALEVARRAGFDVSETARAISREHGIEVFDHFEKVPRGRWDVVIARHVLEHLADPAGTLVELGGLLAPEGRLLVILPVEHGRRHERSLPESDPDRHLFSWKLHHLANLLAVCGFEVERFGYEWHSMQRLLVWTERLFGLAVYDRLVSLAGHLRRQSEMVVWAHPAAATGDE